MKRKFFILFLTVFSVMLTSCDWHADPKIVGYSTMQLNNDGRFVCSVDDNSLYYIDSVLTIKDGIKLYEAPTCGNDVTVFTFNIEDGVRFYKGHVSSEEVKRVYFQGDSSSATLNFTLFFMVVVILYGWASCNYRRTRNMGDKNKSN